MNRDTDADAVHMLKNKREHSHTYQYKTSRIYFLTYARRFSFFSYTRFILYIPDYVRESSEICKNIKFY